MMFSEGLELGVVVEGHQQPPFMNYLLPYQRNTLFVLLLEGVRESYEKDTRDLALELSGAL